MKRLSRHCVVKSGTWGTWIPVLKSFSPQVSCNSGYGITYTPDHILGVITGTSGGILEIKQGIYDVQMAFSHIRDSLYLRKHPFYFQKIESIYGILAVCINFLLTLSSLTYLHFLAGPELGNRYEMKRLRWFQISRHSNRRKCNLETKSSHNMF